MNSKTEMEAKESPRTIVKGKSFPILQDNWIHTKLQNKPKTIQKEPCSLGLA
jgi:hypothetical protein